MSLPVDLTFREPAKLADLLDRTSQVLCWAEEAFGFMERLHSDGDHDGHVGFAALSGLCALGIGGHLAAAGDDLVNLAKALRETQSEERQ